MGKPKKIRIDQLLVDRKIAGDLDKAHRLILAGEIRTEDRLLDKAGEKVPENISLRPLKPRSNFVSRGGDKLAKAFDAFSFSPDGLKCLDIGASTGGFTHVLLSRGASGVVAIDVGYGQIDWELRQDPRVKVIERTNFRNLPDSFFPEPFDLIVIDVSFISLKLIIPRALTFLKPAGNLFALVKPQFEAEQKDVEKGGFVRDPQVQRDIVLGLTEAFKADGLFLKDLDLVSAGPKKNREYMSWWSRSASAVNLDEKLARLFSPISR